MKGVRDMSQYINFYIKSKKTDEYIMLDSFSRNSVIYSVCDGYVPYERGIDLPVERLSNIIDSTEDECKKYKASIKKTERLQMEVRNMNNSVEEKMEILERLNDNLEELSEIVEEYNAAKSFFRVLKNIADSSHYLHDGGVIYAGIEWDPNYEED